MCAIDHPLFEQIAHVLDLVVGRGERTHGTPVESDTEECVGGIEYRDIRNHSVVAACHDLDRGASKWLIHCHAFDSPIGDAVKVTWVLYSSTFATRRSHTDPAVENGLRGLVDIVDDVYRAVLDSGMRRETNTVRCICRSYLNRASIQVKRHSLAYQKRLFALKRGFNRVLV